MLFRVRFNRLTTVRLKKRLQMKNRQKWLMMTAITVIFGFVAAACDNGTSPTADPCVNGHVFPEWTAPTCEAAGNSERACVRSGCDATDTRTEGFAAPGHDWEYDPNAVPPTCTIAGLGHRHCNRCDTDEQGIIPPLGHSFTLWQETTPATCTDAAIDTEKCDVCGTLGTETDEGHSALGHSSGVGAVEVSCEVDGYSGGSGPCIREGCDVVLPAGEVIPKWNHQYHDWTAPTCTTAGNSERDCTNDCGTIDTRDTGFAALGHDYGGWSTKTPATCTTDEVLKRTCSVCSHEETTTGIGAIGHTYVWTTTTNPTNIREGIQTEICSNNSSHTRGTRTVSSLPITTSTELTNAFSAISSGANNQSYNLNISGNIAVSGSTSPRFGFGTGKTITMVGNGRLYLTSQGNLIHITGGQTLIINSPDLTLEGFSGNNAAVIELFGGSARLELKDGTISGNTNSGMGGGVSISLGGTFEMSGGYICGNTASNGGGVFVASGCNFIMNGFGQIYNNKTSSFQGRGGGVYIQMGSFSRTTYGGSIYGGGGNNEPGVDNIASADTFGHAVYYQAGLDAYYNDNGITSWQAISTDDPGTNIWTKR